MRKKLIEVDLDPHADLIKSNRLIKNEVIEIAETVDQINH